MSPIAINGRACFLAMVVLFVVASSALGQPDLRPTGITAPALGTTQHTIDVSWDAENQGTEEAKASWYDTLYLSADEVVGAGDITLAQLTRSQPVAAGGTYTLGQTVTVPNVPAGNYYLIVLVDTYNYVYEADEGNNQRVASLEIKTPDLKPTGMTAPPSAATQHTMEVSWDAENQGNAEAKASWYDTLYLSADEVVGAGDLTLAQLARSQPVAAGGTYTLAQTVTVPNVPAGNYYLIVLVDVYNYVYEADEGNNQRVTSIEIKTPDLRPTGITAPALGTTQHTIDVSWDVENRGNGEAKASWYDTLYLSADEVVGAGDLTLAQLARTSAVAAGGTYTLAQTVTVPNVAAGNYYLIVLVDVYNYVYEADEGNNQRVASIEIKTPDLRPTGITAPPSGATQHTIDVSWDAENRGNGEAKASWYDTLYLSADEVVGAGDLTLAQLARSQPVAAGGTYTLAQTVTVPNVAAGNYYLIVLVDAYNYVYEESEANNQFAKAIAITGPETLRIVAINKMANGRLRIDFQSISGQMHHLEMCGLIEEGLWAREPFYVTDDGTETQDEIAGTGAILSIYVVPAGPRAFYRIAAP